MTLLANLGVWWQQVRALWALEDIGDRVDGAPTGDEMAARCAELDRRRAEAEQCAREALVARDQARPAVIGGTGPLTADQVARLAWVIEEAGEVQQAAAKILREVRTWEERAARVQLESELGDLLAALEPLYETGDLRRAEVGVWRRRGLAKLRRRLGPAEAQAAQENGQGQ